MYFDVDFDGKDLKGKVYKNFLGVDYATSVFNVDSRRAIEMKNYINVNGINHKRNGWNEIAQFQDKINGFWSFKDKNKEVHKIIQAGTKFYKLTHIGTNSFTTTYEKIKIHEDVDTSKIINERGYGVVAGERLYLLCGDYLVYGNWGNGWEIRRVEDNEDTFIPTTTVGIVNVNSNIANTRTGYDKVNALNRRRKNKLIGEKRTVKLDITKTADTYASQYAGYIQSVNSLEYENLIKTKITIINDESVYNISNDFELNSNLTTLTYDPNNSINDFNSMWYDGYNSGDLSSFFVYFKVTQKYENNKLYLVVSYYFKEGKEQTRVLVEGVQTLKYMLDTDSIDEDEEVKVYNYETLIDSANYTINYEEGSITFTNEYLPSIEGQSNITVEFSKYIEGYADRINKCRFGTLYGYNAGRDNLFVAGNPDYPNVDFYSSETYSVASNFDGQLKNYGDFTYFPITNYKPFGNEISKIVDYALLGDGTQIIMKEAVKNEPTIFFRTSSTISATDELGNAITSLSGYQYQEIVYPVQTGTIGEGCITRFGNANLSGDILMLSQNGIYGIEYGNNIVVDDKYAKERSRLIYGRLKDFDLSKAVSIVYKNRYYLAVGGEENLCFVADARYKSSLEGDEPNTFNYEWWVWDNIPAYTFFIIDDKLSFGTYDGKICCFMEGNFIDKSYSIMELGALTTDDNYYDYDESIFTISMTYDNDVAKLTENTNNRFTPVSMGSPLYEIVEDEIGQVHFNELAQYGYVIKNIPNRYGSFTLVNELGDEVIIGTQDGTRPNMTGYFTFCENVVSEWWFPVVDLGTIEYTKNLQSVTVSPETTVGGEIEFGVETKKNLNIFETKGASMFDWNRLDFTNWTFETKDFPKAYTKKVKLRGNYFRFFFRSKNDSDGAVNQISLVYTIGKRNRGVN